MDTNRQDQKFDQIFCDKSKWFVDLGGIAGIVPIADSGTLAAEDYKFKSAGKDLTRVHPLKSFQACRYDQNKDNPTGSFFTPDIFSLTGEAMGELHLTGHNNSPNYGGLVQISTPFYVGRFTGTDRIQIIVEDKTKVQYDDFTATEHFRTIAKGDSAL